MTTAPAAALTTDSAANPARPSWLFHPIQAWRALAAAATAQADADARAAGLTVQVLPNGLRRYRDPRLDQLAAHRATQFGTHGGASEWSSVRLVTARRSR